MKVTIIIPVYNEEKTIATSLKHIKDLHFTNNQKEMIIVNDASTDSTEQEIKKIIQNSKDIKYFSHTKNMGKGAAVRTGIKNATGDYIIIHDADLEYNPLDIQRLINALTDSFHVVYGSRLKRSPHFNGEEGQLLFVLHFFGNRFLSLITSILYGQWVTDIETCYKLFPRSVANSLHLTSNGFGFEAEITAKFMKKGYRIKEVSITTTPRGYKEGKKLKTLPDGIEALWILCKNRFIA